MVQFTKAFVALLFSAGTALQVGATVARLESDISNIATKVNALNSSISDFPASGGTASDALEILNTVTALDASLQTAITDANSTDAFSVSDGNTVIDSVQAIVPVIVSALNGLVAKKASISTIPFAQSVIKKEIATFNTSLVTLSGEIISNLPESLQAKALELETKIDGLFTAALDAYA